MSLRNYTNAIKCYEEQLERAKETKDLVVEAQAFGNLGIARLNMGHFEDAIGYFEQQLATLEQVKFFACIGVDRENVCHSHVFPANKGVKPHLYAGQRQEPREFRRVLRCSRRL